MVINANTKISALLKQHPDALETIVSISPKFKKLHNPFLRKIMASRTTIVMASRLGGCSVNDFFSKLQPLGFEIDKETIEDISVKGAIPEFLKNSDTNKIIDLDVRPVFDSGKDPLSIIMQKVKQLQSGQVLKIINTFEPTPLIHLLGKQGFESYTDTIEPDLIHTFFYKKSSNTFNLDAKAVSDSKDWEQVLQRFREQLVTIDVRHLEMPLPMHTILEALSSLPDGKALYVYHKRIPVFLLPELQEQKFNFRIKEIKEGEVHLLIYRD